MTAKFTWLSSEGHCNLSAFEQTLQMAATVRQPTSTALAGYPDLSPSSGLARITAILWSCYSLVHIPHRAESIPRISPREYTTSQAPWKAHPVSGKGAENCQPMVVGLGNLTGEVTRQWAAVLVRGRVGRQPYLMSVGDFRPGVSQRSSLM